MSRTGEFASFQNDPRNRPELYFQDPNGRERMRGFHRGVTGGQYIVNQRHMSNSWRMGYSKRAVHIPAALL